MQSGSDDEGAGSVGRAGKLVFYRVTLQQGCKEVSKRDFQLLQWVGQSYPGRGSNNCRSSRAREQDAYE